MPKRARSRVATAAGPAHELDGAAEGDEIEILWRHSLWYRAIVLETRNAGKQPAQVRFRYVGHSSRSKGAWISAADPNVRYVTTEANRWQRHLSSFGRVDGHVEQDEWMVEKILEDRGEHDAKEYLVRWAGWTSEYDAWRSADDVSDDLVVAYQAERDRQRLAAEKAERDERALYAAEAIALLQARLAAKLMKQRKSAAATTILRLDLCEEWKLRAIHEYLETRVPDGDVFSGHLTAIKRTVGASGRPFADATDLVGAGRGERSGPFDFWLVEVMVEAVRRARVHRSRPSSVSHSPVNNLSCNVHTKSGELVLTSPSSECDRVLCA